MPASKGSTLNHAFETGDFHTVAADGPPDDWRTYAALGLCGHTKAGLDGMATFDDPDARFYQAVTHWLDSDEDAAARLLENCDGEYALNLLNLIKKSKIQLLTQLPWSRFGEGPHTSLEHLRRDPKFAVQNIGLSNGDLKNEVNADIHRFVDTQNPPDLYFAQMVEWQMIPPNIQQLPCPILGQTADFDLYLHTALPWLRLFDQLMVTDRTEYFDTSRLVDAPVATFPKTFCLPKMQGPYERCEKDIDLLMTGTSFHPYHRDKADLIRQILSVEGIVPFFMNGYLDWPLYYRMQARSRLSVSYVRHPGATPSRGLETLAMGTVLLAQPETTMRLWVGEDEGLVTYEPTETGLADAIRKVLTDYPRYAAAAERGQQIVRDEFNPARVWSQYFRFAVFMAARPRRDRTVRPRPVHKRIAATQAWVQPDPNIYTALRANALAPLQNPPPGGYTVESLNNIVRETALLVVPFSQNDSPNELEKWYQATLDMCRAAIEAIPNSLSLRFNFIRVALHFGTEADIQQALGFAAETLNVDPALFKLDALDDVMPWDYCNEFFNYRSYFDLATEETAAGTDTTAARKDLILASLYHYVGTMTGQLDLLQRAVALDPVFPAYRLSLAKSLDAAADKASAERAVAILVPLASNPLVAVQALSLLQSIVREHDLTVPALPALERSVSVLRDRTYIDNSYQSFHTGAYFRSQRLGLGRNTGVEIYKDARPAAPKLSVLLCDLNGSVYPELMASLRRQTLDRSGYEVLCTEAYARRTPHMMAQADYVVAQGQITYIPHRNIGFNAVLAEAKGDYVMFVNQDAALPETALADILSVLEDHDLVTDPGSVETNVLALRRDLAVQFGGLDEVPFRAGALSGPADLAVRLQDHGHRLANIPNLPAAAHPRTPAQTTQQWIQNLWPQDFSPNLRLPLIENPMIKNLRLTL